MAIRQTIYARSPFLVKVANPTQIGAKVELYIWNSGDVLPFEPTKTFSGKIPSTNKRELIFNISPYIREFIRPYHNITEDYDNIYTNEFNYCFVRVKRYYETSGGYILIDTKDYDAVNGWTEYNNGANSVPTGSIYYFVYGEEVVKLLYNKNVDFNMSNNYNGLAGVPVLLQLAGSTNSYQAKIGDYTYNFPTSTQSSDTLYCSIPLPYLPEGRYNIEFYRNGVYYSSLGMVNYKDDCKYTPIAISYVNQWGGVEWIMFYGNSSQSFEVKSTDFSPFPRLLNPNTNYTTYNYQDGQNGDMNINGTKTIKLNTGWVDENYYKKIYALMHSESIKCSSTEFSLLPVILKSKNMKIQKHITEKLINYELEFEFAFNTINNVI